MPRSFEFALGEGILVVFDGTARAGHRKLFPGLKTLSNRNQAVKHCPGPTVDLVAFCSQHLGRLELRMRLRSPEESLKLPDSQQFMCCSSLKVNICNPGLT